MCVPASRIFVSISLASGVGARRDEQTAPRKQQRPHGGHARYELTTTDGECATASATFSRPWATPPSRPRSQWPFPQRPPRRLRCHSTVTPWMVLRSPSLLHLHLHPPPHPRRRYQPTSGPLPASRGRLRWCWLLPYRPRSVTKPVRGARSGRYRDLRWADALVGVVVPLAGGVLLLLGPAAAAPFSDPGVEGPGGSLSLSTPCMFAVGWGPDLVS